MAKKDQDEERKVKIIFDTNAQKASVETSKLGGSLDQVEESAKSTGKAFKDLDQTFEQVYGDIKPLTARMGEAEDRLYELALAGQTASEEYKLLLASVANYRKIQVETDRTVDAAATTLAQKLGGAAQIAAVGVQGVTAGMALFGDQSEDTEKALLKVQSAMAFADAISSVSELGGQFRVLKSLVVDSTIVNKANAAATGLATIATKLFGGSVDATSTSFKFLKGAIAATGIGLLVVGVVALVQNFDKVKEVVLNFVPSLASVGTAIKNIVNAITDFIGVTSQADRAIAKSKEQAEKSLAQNQRYLERNASTLSESQKKEIELRNEHFGRISEGRFSEAESLKIYHEAQRKEVNEKNKVLNDLEKTAQEKRNAEAKALRDKAREEQNAIDLTIRQAETDRLNKIALDNEKAFDDGLKIQQDAAKATADALLSENQLKVQAENEAYAIKLEALKLANLGTEEVEAEHKRVLAELNNEFFATAADKAKTSGDKEKQIDQDVADAKVAIQQKSFEVAEKGILLLASIFGKSKVIQKAALIADSALAIARMVINTRSANIAVRAKNALIPAPVGPALSAAESTLNNVSAGIGIAATVAATAKGLSALGGGGSVSGSSVGGAGGGGRAAAPPPVAFNNTAENQIGQSLGRAQADQPPIQVSVNESDITTAQKNVQVLVNKNSF
jgi:flagellar biosynthesis protein FliQ